MANGEAKGEGTREYAWQSVVFSKAERMQVRQAAVLSEQSASAFIRAAAVKAAARVMKQTLERAA